jgi:glycosyltransferase involved in cell wall biosynthesis
MANSADSVSFIISARNEYPQIAMTVDNLMLDCWQAGIKFEIIIADNGSVDNTTKFYRFAWADAYAKNATNQRPKELQRSTRGMANEGLIRFCYDPVFSNVGARHNAVKYARYPNIIFADAHISVKPNTVKYLLETLDKHKGIVHAPVCWMGASIYDPHPGYQYSYKIGEKIWGTWNSCVVSSENPFYIPVSGHCFIAVKKQQYLDFGGYDTNQRVYGGGENYLDTLYWLLGSNVMVDPRALVFHLSSGRGYSYDVNSLIHNMILTAYTLGGHKWAERILLAYMDKPGTDISFLQEIYDIAVAEGQSKRDFISSRQKMSLEELLGIGKEFDCDGHCYKGQKHAMRIWDKMNDSLHGHHLSFVVVYDDWLGRLRTDAAKNFFSQSPHQK